MGEVRVQIGGCSIIGDRTAQQDAIRYTISDGVLLAVVCDGMGGMSGGEMASNTAVYTIFQEFELWKEKDESQFVPWMEETFRKADMEVASLTDSKGNLLRGGTTSVAVMIKENRMYWGCVGDSRIYYMNSSGIFNVTRMHNYSMQVGSMVESGELTQEQAQRECQGGRGEALISFLGIGGLPLIDTSSQPIVMAPGDIVILSSDGLYKSLENQQVQAIVQESGGNMELASRRLCTEALRLAVTKQDNTSVIAIKCLN